MPPEDGVSDLPVSDAGVPAGEDNVDESDYGAMKLRLYSHMDRHTVNAVTFDKMLDTNYTASEEFRSANSARIVMEAGSGRTRAETNLPASTSAAGNAGSGGTG